MPIKRKLIRLDFHTIRILQNSQLVHVVGGLKDGGGGLKGGDGGGPKGPPPATNSIAPCCASLDGACPMQ